MKLCYVRHRCCQGLFHYQPEQLARLGRECVPLEPGGGQTLSSMGLCPKVSIMGWEGQGQ